jgi:hypothetical protein
MLKLAPHPYEPTFVSISTHPFIYQHMHLSSMSEFPSHRRMDKGQRQSGLIERAGKFVFSKNEGQESTVQVAVRFVAVRFSANRSRYRQTRYGLSLLTLIHLGMGMVLVYSSLKR